MRQNRDIVLHLDRFPKELIKFDDFTVKSSDSATQNINDDFLCQNLLKVNRT